MVTYRDGLSPFPSPTVLNAAGPSHQFPRSCSRAACRSEGETPSRRCRGAATGDRDRDRSQGTSGRTRNNEDDATSARRRLPARQRRSPHRRRECLPTPAGYGVPWRCARWAFGFVNGVGTTTLPRSPCAPCFHARKRRLCHRRCIYDAIRANSPPTKPDGEPNKKLSTVGFETIRHLTVDQSQEVRGAAEGEPTTFDQNCTCSKG